jgi:hypothetical protein
MTGERARQRRLEQKARRPRKAARYPIELLHGLVSSISENEITEVLKRELDPSIDALGFVP